MLLYADGYLKDNRLPPEGFTAARANAIEPQTLPVGVTGDSDFSRAAGVEGSDGGGGGCSTGGAGRFDPFLPGLLFAAVAWHARRRRD